MPRTPARVLVAGASGLVGSALVARLREHGHEVLTLVRRRPTAETEINWAPAARTMDFSVLDDVDVVIGLSGASVGRIPWTPSYRRTLVESRVQPTQALAEAMNMAKRPPSVFLSASAVGIYGDRPGERLTEQSQPGRGFFPELVERWEAASAIAPKKTRVVNLRSGVVVARGGGMAPVRLTTAFGLGARFGTGGQHWPWISLHDEVGAIRHLMTSTLRGPVNLVGPVPATSDRVTRAFADAQRRWRPFVAPERAVTALLGEAGQRLLFDSMKVLPTRLSADGFAWRDETIEDAVRRVVRGPRRGRED
jgi:uncharacterized protein